MPDTIDKTEMTDRQCLELAYGLLWHAPTDRSSWLGLLTCEARRAILETMDRDAQSRGIALAKSLLPRLKPLPPDLYPEWEDVEHPDND